MELEDRTTGKRLRRRIEDALLPMVLLLAIAAPVFGLGTKRSLAQFGLETWQSDSGLPQNTVHAVLQTRDGFLWIGTDAGLVRFDGVSFRTYDGENTPQFRSDIVSGLEEDRAGSLWISTTAGLVRERDGAFALFTVAQGLPSNAASATHVTAAGHLLAFTAAGVATLRGERFEVVAGTSGMQAIEGGPAIAEDALGHVAIAGSREVVSLEADGRAALTLPVGGEIGELRAVAFLRAGELWVGGRDGIETLEGGHATRLTGSDRLPSSDITALLPDGSGGMWIGTARGLAWWHDGSITRLGAVGEIASASVERLYRDREGTVWAATSQGVARVVDGAVDVIPQRSRLKEVLSILEDREGSMWLGTANGGLTALRERAFSTVSEQDGLAAGAVRAIFQAGDDTIWIGTNGGGLDRIDRGKVSMLVSRPALSSDVVLSVAKIGEDLWVGTPNGLDRVRHGSVRVFTTADGLADDFVRSLYADRDGSLWIGTRNGLSHLAGDRFVSYSRMDGLGSDLIGAILRGSRGELWVGTLGGLSRWNGGGFENFSVKDGLATDAVTSMLEDSTGTLWVGTQEGGLNRVREGRITALPVQKSGLPETIFGILEDSMGELWLSSRKGIARVGTGSLSAFADGRSGGPVVRMYGVPDGMRIRECSSGGHPAAWRMHDGSLWFATLDGAAFVSPEGISRNTLAPATVIEQVLLEDRPVEAGLLTGGKALTLPPGERRITVQYAGLSFVAPQKVRYRYRLEGFDKDWVDAGDRREAFYTNVPPGRYRFEVLSANNDGVWSTTAAEFSLRVEPTLLQTRWFYGLLALGLAGLGFGAYRWRVLSVEAQYKAVLGERGRIAREIHDTLAQGYVAISVQLELTARLMQSSKEAALGQLEQTKELVRGSLSEARSSIWNLRSQSEGGTLPSLLAGYIEGRASADGPEMKLEVKGTYRPVTRTTEQEILRVAQEAVANALRHARAKHIRVDLRYDASTLRLRVSDDGAGFAGSSRDLSANGHFGVQGMRERAARINGRLRIESGPGKGTTVELEVKPGGVGKEEMW